MNEPTDETEMMEQRVLTQRHPPQVHGSLARAGKVRSQTPKVAPQEKPKVPKGRAKKRLQYTRRFVNVTLTGGKRKVREDRHAVASPSHPSQKTDIRITDEPQPWLINALTHSIARQQPMP